MKKGEQADKDHFEKLKKCAKVSRLPRKKQLTVHLLVQSRIPP